MAISEELEIEIKETVRRIKELFGFEISKIQATKIIALKNRKYKEVVDLERLKRILGGKNA